MNRYKLHLKLAEAWLLNSGIQNTNAKNNTFGSFNSWFDLEKNKFSFAYSEITGYGINTLLYLHKQEGEKSHYLNRAKIAGDWLVDRAFNSKAGGIRCRFEHESKKFSKKVCTFDNGMCLNSLVNLYKQTGRKKYLNFSIKIAEWILTMQKKDGSFYSRMLIGYDKLEESGDKWSKQSGCFHAKLAIGLLNLGFLLGEDKYTKAGKNICEFALRFQKRNGRFITDIHNGETFLHPVCYTAEGLLVASLVLKNKTYLRSVKKFLGWILRNRLKTNGFPAYFLNNKFIGTESPEINTQVLRLCLIINAVAEKVIDKNIFDLCIKNLLRYQSRVKSKRALGGFYSGQAWFQERNNYRKHINSWVTMFIVQFLVMYQIGFKREDIFYLV